MATVPKIGVITINYNEKRGLEKTISSVSDQTFQNFEYIVIDGASTDSSVDVIAKHKSKINFSLSEKDSGIYNAMNKGIKAATAEYLIFMNSGDIFLDNATLAKAAELLDGTDIIYGDIIWDDQIKNKHRREFFPSDLTFRFFVETSLPHQATFIKRSLFEKFGLYDESLKIVADWEFFLLSIIKNGASYKHIDLPICLYDQNGVSSNPANRQKVLAEKNRVLDEHFPLFYKDYDSIAQLQKKRVQQFVHLQNFPVAYRLVKWFMSLVMFFVPKMKPR